MPVLLLLFKIVVALFMVYLVVDAMMDVRRSRVQELNYAKMFGVGDINHYRITEETQTLRGRAMILTGFAVIVIGALFFV